eukprot:TRINITY_DN81502_c0_g1_i1.p1 TRINITY_DN81502_c0_g1~~TRINITY_DN81502_c0_g1_i1.p1  ORF type:complete len:228 (+),score=68.58 TRINITY_DN81502_c0_g1_i1:32-715(+)
MAMISTEAAPTGATGQLPTSTKSHLYIFGGHSGQGMVMATEIANSGKTACITTVSKRGRPSAPGPAAAFAQAIAKDTVHYMAACDQNDAKAVECLMDWQPPSRQIMNQQQGPTILEMTDKIKQEMESMNRFQLERALETVESMKVMVIKSQRQIKGRLQQKDCKPEEKGRLQDLQLEFQEKETAFMELVADLQQKIDAQPTASELTDDTVELLLKRMEKELALQQGF